jgi:hypothetical protein
MINGRAEIGTATETASVYLLFVHVHEDYQINRYQEEGNPL